MKILVIGASARAAAQSVRRAGYAVVALDLFVDRDLREIADCETILQFPDSIVEQARRWPDHTLLLAGGMENFPEIVEALERHHRLLGPSAQQIRQLRCFEHWRTWIEQLADESWLCFPETRFLDPATTNSEALDHSAFLDDQNLAWLWKPSRSSGGMRMEHWHPSSDRTANDGYIQRFIPGAAIGVTFECEPSRASMIGAMRNWTLGELLAGRDLTSIAHPFCYVGSSGPYVLAKRHRQRLETWIGQIASEIDYRGILQIDLVMGKDGRLYFLECNPRWSASMELVEVCTATNLIETQIRLQYPMLARSAIGRGSCSNSLPLQAMKHILYAASSQVVSQKTSDQMMETSNWQSNLELDQDQQTVSGWSDIPWPGSAVPAGAPIATVMAVRLKQSDRQCASSAGLREGDTENAEGSDVWPEIDEQLNSVELDFYR